MQKLNIDLRETNQFSKLFLDYIHQNESTKQFYTHTPSIDGIEAALQQRQFDSAKRKVLVTEIKKQYAEIHHSDLTKANIESLLHDNTYTVTCGHQLNIFTGPLYFIYKILSTIKLSEELKKRFPARHFVPIYWMATEDHDFEEINHFWLFGKKHILDIDVKGAVGKIPCKVMNEFLDSLPDELQTFSDFYRNSSSLAEAMTKLVNHLFTDYGLIILDPDVKSLRAEFASYVQKELKERNTFQMLNNTSRRLKELGHEPQVSGREINLMYAEDHLRERIIFENNAYKVLNTPLEFTYDEIASLASDHPERFSTNVVLRPVYQEVILPNIAFVGGPAEVIYWLQLKDVFSYFGVPQPVILPRNFAMIITENQSAKLKKFGLAPQDLILDERDLKSKIASQDIELNFDKEYELLKSLEAELSSKAELVDKTLTATVAAEINKSQKIVDELQKRLLKGLEKKNTDAITQVLNIKQKLYPNHTPQERVDNFLNFYLNDKDFIHKLHEIFDPLDFQYYIIQK